MSARYKIKIFFGQALLFAEGIYRILMHQDLVRENILFKAITHSG
jgi:hypothetical protein